MIKVFASLMLLTVLSGCVAAPFGTCFSHPSACN